MKILPLIILSIFLPLLGAAGGTDGVPQSAAMLYHESVMYEQGRDGFVRDSVKALALLRQAADSSYAPAMNYLGYAYTVPLLGLHQNSDSALFWIERAATCPEPDPKAFNNLGMLLLTGSYGVRRDYAKARYWLQRGSELGVPTASASLARLYLEGLGVEPDTAKAIELLHRSASAGLHDAGMELAELLLPQFMGLTAEEKVETALPYYHERILSVALPLIRVAADDEHPLALAIMAQCAAEGIGMCYDYNLAVELFARAASLDEPHAQFIIAETLQAFPDILADRYPELDADTLYRKAASAGIYDASAATAPLRP